MSKAYTGKGDKGITKTYTGTTIAKDTSLIIANGKIDSLLSAIDLAKYYSPKYATDLGEVSKNLWIIGSELSGAEKKIEKADLQNLEQKINALDRPPNDFIRFTKLSSIYLNECRVRCREAEISLVQFYTLKLITEETYAYMNRLSSYFFMLAYKSETTGWKCLKDMLNLVKK